MMYFFKIFLLLKLYIFPSNNKKNDVFERIFLFLFNRSGRTTPKATPPHRFNDFTIRSYAPVAFRHFREKFNIKPADYLVNHF